MPAGLKRISLIRNEGEIENALKYWIIVDFYNSSEMAPNHGWGENDQYLAIHRRLIKCAILDPKMLDIILRRRSSSNGDPVHKNGKPSVGRRQIETF